MSLHDLRALGLMLLIFVMVVLAAVLAWQHLDWVGFSLFALLFGWVVYQWRQYKELEDAVRMAEKRLCALEQRAGWGDGDQWLRAIKVARVAARMAGGGPVAEWVSWPPTQDEPDEETEAE